jgi:hypothetical protein
MAQFVPFGSSLAIWHTAGLKWKCSVWREREFCKSTDNVAEEHMVHIECVAELNACLSK